MLNSKVVLANTGITFGTSGARGLVSEFTPQVCAAFTHAFIKTMKENFSFKYVALAIDNRPSSYAMAQACADALLQCNVIPIYYGVIPTPALAYQSMQNLIPCIMVTGSHIPFDRNGIKFYRPDGEINKDDEKAILNFDCFFNPISSLVELIVDHTAAEAYCERYTSLFSNKLLSDKHIGIYEHSSAGRDLYAKIFTALGAKVTSLERSDTFVPIDTEAVSEIDILRGLNWSHKYEFDAIFSTDGDGDRPLIADENGEWLRGDILGLLCANALNIEALAIPVSCNTAIEKCGYFKYVSRTRIGSPYVIADFFSLLSSYKRVAGFEANGGFLLGSDVEVNDIVLKALPTRDALLPALMLFASTKDQTISSLVNSLPPRFTHSDRITNFPTNKSQLIINLGIQKPKELLLQLGFDEEITDISVIDGLRLTLTSGVVIHLRPSGNAPELRCYAEASSFAIAKYSVELALDKITHLNF
tara:strand:- start:2015 stop:3436 length:1422 start_codon:yes stop_codon:yes gene_type:complete